MTIYVAKPPASTAGTAGGGMADSPTSPSAPTTQTAPVAAAGTTLAAMNGSFAYKYVVAIEGYPHLLTDANTVAAVNAWGGTDYTSALGGLYVQLDNEQRLDPWDPFQGGGKCKLMVQADADDTFGIDVHRKADGAESMLRAACNRVGTPQGDYVKVSSSPTANPYLAIDSGAGFVAGDAFVGTECVEVSSADSQRLNTSRRGKYSPFGTAGGSGDRWFSQHHRVSADTNGVSLNPVVSQQPRTWIGKWVGVWMHVVDGSGNLNAKADALCVYAGTIVGTADDPNTGYTVVELEHVLDTLKNVTIGRDMWSSSITEGIYLVTGRTFTMTDTSGGTTKTANALTVVASGATGANQINAGYYSCGEICSALSAWLAAENIAARINGTYVWRSPVTSGSAGLRTKCYWRIANATAVGVSWRLEVPLEIAMFLGLCSSTSGGGFDTFSSLTGGQQGVGDSAMSNLDWVKEGGETPWRTVLFRGDAAAKDLTINCENERGTAIDQYAALPSSDKPTTAYVLDPTTGVATQVDPTTLAWGVFMIDEKYLMVASINVQSNTTTLQNCRPMSFAMPGVTTGLGTFAYGRRQDDANVGPATIRQIFIIETSPADFIKKAMYSTGTTGYNHPTHDALGFGLGVGIPGALLGGSFEQSLDNLPGATSPIVVVINESIRLGDLLGADLVLRRAFPVWKQGGLRFGHWVAPTADAAIATLDETNKAEPSGQHAEQRSSSVLDDRWVRNVVKIDYDRIFTLDKDGTYQSEIGFEDRVSVDDASGKSKVATIKARNTYSQFLGTGSGVEALAPGFMATLPMFTRPARKLARTIDHRFYERLSVGDIVLAVDAFARDPETGTRGIAALPAVVTRVRYNPGGPTPGDPSKVMTASGEAELFLMDGHRDSPYSAAAELAHDYTNPVSGWSAGYNATTLQLTLLPHAYSESSEPADHAYFVANDRVVIVEIDPTLPSSAQSWRRTITATDGNGFVTINQTLDGFSASKFYRVVYDNYAAQQSVQLARNGAVFASAGTGKILSTKPARHLTATAPPSTATTANANEPAEILPSSAWGDGVPMDVGHECSVIRALNAFVDGKSLHCSPMLSAAGAMSVVNHPNSRYLASMAPIFLGKELLSQRTYRNLYIAPLVRIAAAAGYPTQTIWVTLTSVCPTAASAFFPSSSGYQISLQGGASWTKSWTIGANSPGVAGPWQTLATQGFPIVKGLDGYAWLVVECQAAIDFGGFARCQEGPRIVQ